MRFLTVSGTVETICSIYRGISRIEFNDSKYLNITLNGITKKRIKHKTKLQGISHYTIEDIIWNFQSALLE